MEADARELKRELGRQVFGRGRRVPSEVKARVRSYAPERRQQGATLGEISNELGLSVRNVQRWSATGRRAGRGRAIVPVAVEVIAERRATVSVVSPSGYRLEGLGLEEAVQLLRALR
jgi:transposase